MVLTAIEAAKYANGELRLSASRKTGKLRLIQSKRRTNDKGITSLKRRKYYRMWYLSNRNKRVKYMADLKKETKVKHSTANTGDKQKRMRNPTPEHTAALKKAADARYYLKRKLRLEGEKRRADIVARSWNGTDRRAKPRLTIVPTHKPKQSWLSRLFGGW